jgi:predicted NAD/FAD-binding protein
VSGYSLVGPTPWRTVKQGSREYVRRLSACFAPSVRTGRGVRSIRRERDGVTVTSADGGVHRFDQVVLATDAGTALKLLEDPTSDEALLLGEVEYEPATLVLHTDARVRTASSRGGASTIWRCTT